MPEIDASFDTSWEANIYSQGKITSRYPFGELVSFVMRLYGADLKKGLKPKVLELGSGTGNNLAFLAKEGFETYGIEGSLSACQTASQFLAKQSLKAHIIQGDFVNLPFENDFFDLVIDREAVYCNKKQAIMRVAQEVRRCLKKGGRFLAFTYSTAHGSIQHDGGELMEPNTYTDFKNGGFKGAGVTHFFSEKELREEYFQGFEIEFMYHHSLDLVVPEARNQYAEYITCGKK